MDRAQPDGLHTLGRWTTDRARTAPRRIAVYDGPTALSYEVLEARAEHLAGVLHAAYAPGERIATITGNTADHVVLFFACAKAGMVLVPLSWRLSARELADQLADAEPALLLVEQEFDALADSALSRLPQPPPKQRLGLDGVEAGFGGPPRQSARYPVRDHDPLLMVYTSGTTGRPKGAVLSHANCFWTNLSLSRVVPLSQDDVVLAVLPQFHVGGWNSQPLLAWWAGASVVLERSFDAGRALQLIDQHGVTTTMAVPTMYLLLAEHPDLAASDLRTLRHALVGGAPMPEPLLRLWHSRGVGLAQGYGLTEAAPNVLCLPPDDASRKIGFAGKPYPYVEVTLADPDTGRPLDDSADEGELLVRGPNVFTGYWRNVRETEVALRDGWLHTKDVVRRDAEGFYRVLGRLDDMFISGGENVSPAEIENVLYTHPSVCEAAVIGRPDERWGQVGVAFVVPRAGSRIDPEELIAHCRRELAAYKVPRGIQLVDELPHSPIGKLLRRELSCSAAAAP